MSNPLAGTYFILFSNKHVHGFVSSCKIVVCIVYHIVRSR